MAMIDGCISTGCCGSEEESLSNLWRLVFKLIDRVEKLEAKEEAHSEEG